MRRDQASTFFPEVQSFASTQGCTWIDSSPRAPWTVHCSDKQRAHIEMKGAQRTASAEVTVISEMCIQSFIFIACKSLRYISCSNPHSSCFSSLRISMLAVSGCVATPFHGCVVPPSPWWMTYAFCTTYQDLPPELHHPPSWRDCFGC